MEPGKFPQLARAMPKYDIFPKFVFLDDSDGGFATRLLYVAMFFNVPHYY